MNTKTIIINCSECVKCLMEYVLVCRRYLCNGKLSDFTEDIERRIKRLKINEIFRSEYMMDTLPLSDAKRADLKEGIAERLLAGKRKKSIETAKKMLKNKITPDLIVKCTGLTFEEVLQIKQEM